MTRPVDEARRGELLERIVEYAMHNGIADLSLRPLAKAVGSSPRVLLYYFGSKDELLVEVITRARARQSAAFAHLKLAGLSPREVCTICWNVMSDRQYEPIYQLFFEVYTLALRDPKRFPGFLDRAVGDWLNFIAAPGIAAGAPREEAIAYATVVLAGFRGFLMDLLATRDRERVSAAVQMWLDMISFPKTDAKTKEDIA